MIITSLIIFINLSFSGVCDSLSDLACAPGKFSDGTGTVPSESEVRHARSQYEQSARKHLSMEFTSLINNPDNSFFKESAKQAFGLTDFPACTGSSTKDKSDCDQNIIEGLTNLGENNILETKVDRLGDLESLDFIRRNHMFTSVLDKVTANAEKQLGTEPIKKKIQNTVFPGIKNALITKINSWPLDTKQKQLMISKIKSIRFEGSKCSSFGSNIKSLLKPNAYYNASANTFSYCAGMISESSSDFTLAMIVAHELAHSIDPCNLSNSLNKIMGNSEVEGSVDVLDQQSPYANVISCLRDKASIGAKNFAEPPVQESQSNTYGDPSPPSKETTRVSFCDLDQIGESFSDWVGAEILPEYIRAQHKLTKNQYINGYANAFRPLCKSFTDVDMVTEHPRSQERIDKIIISNPKVRKDMGCPPEGKFVYCSFSYKATPVKLEEIEMPIEIPISPYGGQIDK